PRDVLRVVLEVVVHDDGHAARGDAQPTDDGVVLAIVAPVALADDPRSLSREITDHVPGVVRRRVVRQHELAGEAGRASRRLDRLDERAQAVRALVGGNDDRYGRAEGG